MDTRSFKKTSRRSWWLHVIAPLLVGTSVYLLWRPPNLVFFAWVEWLSLSGVLGTARAAVASWAADLPPFILYNLPDLCWI